MLHSSEGYNSIYHRSYNILKRNARMKSSVVDDEQLALQVWSWTVISSMVD